MFFQFSDLKYNIESNEMILPPVSDFEEDKNEPSTTDFDAILDGVVFDEEPHSVDLKFVSGSWNVGQQKDPVMMMETASVTSENIEQVRK